MIGMNDELAGETSGEPDAKSNAAKEEQSHFRRLSESLSPEQQKALQLLAAGQSIPKVAENVGVHRATIYRWITREPYFRAAYNAWQLEQRESFRAILFKCGETAVQRVATMVDYDHQFAWKVARELGMIGMPHALHTDPDLVEREIELEQMEEQARLDQRRQSFLPAVAIEKVEPPAASPSGNSASNKAGDDQPSEAELAARELAVRKEVHRRMQILEAAKHVG
jgi:hypothetical protein